MKNYLGSLGTVLLTGALILGMGAAAGAQQAPPASQQPMEIPAQYPPQSARAGRLRREDRSRRRRDDPRRGAHQLPSRRCLDAAQRIELTGPRRRSTRPS